MRETYALLLSQLRKIWLKRKFAIPAAVLSCAIGWVVVAELPDVFESTATVFVDTQSTLSKVLDRIAVDTEDLDATFIALARQRLTSRPNLERLARETDLDINAKTPAQMDRLLISIDKHMTIEAQSTEKRRERPRDNIFAIKFEHKNPAVAKKMVSALLDVFNESVLGASRQDNDQTEKFMDQQLQQYQAKLSRTEETLKQFKLRNAASMPSAGKDYYANLQDTRDSARTASLELRQAQYQRDELRQQIMGLTGTRQDSKVAPDVMARMQQYERLRRDLDELLARYTDEHPEVVAVKRRIADLHIDPKLAMASSSGGGAPQGDVGMMTTQLRIELSKAEASVAALSEKAADLRSRAVSMETSVNTIPAVEAQMQELMRDYDVNKEQYAALLQRREAARLAREAGKSNDQALFQVIEPPHVNSQPVGPPRGLLLTAVLAGGLAIGALVGFLISQLRPTFGDIRELGLTTQLRVLGSVGVVRDPTATLRHRTEYLMYAGTLLMLLLVYLYLVYRMADDFKVIFHAMVG